MKPLVIYYSSSSHTAQIAHLIAEVLSCDYEAIRVALPYGDEILNRSRVEIEQGIDPEILPLTKDLNEYDTIFLGTPVWWGTGACPILSLIHSGALAGKDVYPFITTGYDVAGVQETLAKELHASRTHTALIVPFENAIMRMDKAKIKTWLDDHVR